MKPKHISLGDVALLSLFFSVCYSQNSRTELALEEFRAQADCTQCHVEIGKEWSSSAHARAGSSEARRLLASLGEEVALRLRSYYTPAALLVSGLTKHPQSRDVFGEQGVDCLSCHMDGQYRMHGPHGTLAPHKVVQDQSYRTVSTCVSCHGQNDELDQVSSWRQAGFEAAQVPCQSCHMPQIDRQFVQHWVMPDLPVRTGSEHSFRGASDPDFFPSAVSIELKGEDETVSLNLRAGAIGHDFPGIAFRQVVIHTRATDSDGQMVWEKEEFIDGIVHHNRLRPSQTRHFSYSRQGALEVHSRLLYKGTPQTPEPEAILIHEAFLKLPPR
ncbi:cytochrome c family protein [Acidobacteria bacterium AH-259-D05]|nr:cytochrome c family protein [Acidobacteria bacterium AH-259-D05]